MSTPRVTFLLPVHNGAATLAETLAGIQSQTLADFELLIIDDASTDATADLLASFDDARCRIVRNSGRLELAGTLNLGLSLARGDYVARIDADDVCLPRRAATQAAFLDANPGTAAVGSYVETFSADAAPAVVKYPTEPAAVAAALLFRNSLAHPAVMLNRKVLAGHQIRYDTAIRRAQDYALWAACVGARLPLANIPEVLLRYRLHAGQASVREAGESRATAAAVRARLVESVGIVPSLAELQTHEHLACETLPQTREAIVAADAWLRKLLAANSRSGFFECDAFARVLTGRFVAVARIAQGMNVDLSPASSPFARYIHAGALSGAGS